MLKLEIVVVAAILLVGATFGATRSFYVYKHKAEIAQINANTAEKLADHQKKVTDSQDRLYVAKSDLEKLYAKSKSDIQTLNNKHAAWIRANGLRDPGRVAKQQDPTELPQNPGSTSSCNEPATDGKLSEQASEFLLSEAKRADEVVAAYNVCKAWVYKVRSDSQLIP